MARCRVFLCTYRRNNLLPRALESLLSQTFTDWICELHNDDPGNQFPRQLAERIGDPRVIVVDHDRNLGPTPTFNLVFQNAEEPYVSLLEDDNWWEPEFLEVMIDAMDSNPQVDVAWANMRVWEEQADGSWLDSGRDFWNRSPDATPEFFYFPDLERIGEAVHSNGAMLVRTRRITEFAIPNTTTFAAIEPVRERTFPHPLMLVPRRLANFSLTRSTARSADGSTWAHAQILLAASFLKHVPLSPEEMSVLWKKARNAPTRRTNDLLWAALYFSEARHALRFASIGDVIRLAASVARHPKRSWKTLLRVKRERELWRFLDARTAQRVEEASRLRRSSLVSKQLSAYAEPARRE